MRTRSPRSDVQARDTRYWQLMRSGLTNTAACKILGVTRRTAGGSAPGIVSRPPRAAQLHRRDATCRCGSGCRSRTCCGWVTRCAASPPNWAAAPPRSNASWTATATSTAATCRRPPITPPVSSVVGHGRTSWPPTLRCASWCSASSTAAGHRSRSAAGCPAPTPTILRCGCARRPSTGHCWYRAGSACTSATALSCAPAGGSGAPGG
jgi:hypothetical protein